MPSQSRNDFRKKLLPDVTALIDSHRMLNPNGRGRRRLGHITRSGVLMLCAAWEIYNEDVLIECIEFIVKHECNAHNLPDRVKGKICQAAKKDKHEFGVLRLSGNGWKAVYRKEAVRQCEALNTPKFGNISSLFHDWLGIEESKLEDAWRHSKLELNEFVTLRGEIAHRGGDAKYVPISELKSLKEKIDDLIVDTDRMLCLYTRDLIGKQPWRNTS